jgi:hypothetical protein
MRWHGQCHCGVEAALSAKLIAMVGQGTGRKSFEHEAFAAELAASLAGLLSAAARLSDVTPTNTDLPNRPSQEQMERAIRRGSEGAR